MSRPEQLPNGLIKRRRKHTSVEVREINSRLKESKDPDAQLLLESVKGLPEDELVAIETERANRLLPEEPKKDKPPKGDKPA